MLELSFKMKKLQTMSWGAWSAVAGVILFAALALYPVMAAAGKQTADAKGKPDGLLAMIDKAKEKASEAKRYKEMGEPAHGEKRLEFKALATTADGTLYLGSKTGLFRVVAGQIAPVTALPAADIKALASGPDGSLYIATKMGAYHLAAGAVTVSVIREGDIHALGLGSDGAIYLVSKRDGLLTSDDQGATWSPVAADLPFDIAPRGEAKSEERKTVDKAGREAAEAV